MIYSNYLNSPGLGLILLFAVMFFFRLLLAVITGLKLQSIADAKSETQNMFGMTIFLGLFFGLFGMLIATLMTIAIPCDYGTYVESQSNQAQI